MDSKHFLVDIPASTTQITFSYLVRCLAEDAKTAGVNHRRGISPAEAPNAKFFGTTSNNKHRWAPRILSRNANPDSHDVHTHQTLM